LHNNDEGPFACKGSILGMNWPTLTGSWAYSSLCPIRLSCSSSAGFWSSIVNRI